ncbi:hypothetical protein A3753_19105 [Sulfitobacter sp. HI0082]|nr:hypothetical protein A3753_19105 [Sulfitobacter sp. HI0082]
MTILGEASALNAAAVLETRLPEVDFLDWLSDIRAKIPVSKAIRLARAWGKQGVDQVKNNPFLLLAVSDWTTVEAIAEGLAIPKIDVRRQIAALEAVLMGQEGLGGGSTLMSDTRALQLAERLLGYKPCPSIVGQAVLSGAAIRLVGGLQPPGAAHMEAGCALHLFNLAPQPPCSKRTDKERLSDLIASYEGRQRFPLTERQREAIRKSHDHRLLVLAGYAGSGKTTVLRAICETQEAIGKNALIVTLSGRAAQRASEATGRRAITVARFLLEQEKSPSPLGADQVLIADEASMIGLVEFWRILRWLGNASLVLCGDPAQLPPVSPGVVFNALCANRNIVSVVLDKVHRQDEQTGIPKFAESIRLGLTPDMTGFSGAEPGVTFVPCSKDVLCHEIMRVGVEISQGGGTREEMQIIAPTNAGIRHINDFFHRRLVRRKPNLWPHIEHIAEGEPVIWTQNDPQRRLTNGALGRIVKIEGETILAELDGQLHRLSPADRQFVDRAWAISVHKAQGSQWKRVIIPIFESKILDRSLIYTALTRAQEQVIFMGSFSSIRRAVEDRAAADMRNCGFEVWLKLVGREQRRAQVAYETSNQRTVG